MHRLRIHPVILLTSMLVLGCDPDPDAGLESSGSGQGEGGEVLGESDGPAPGVDGDDSHSPLDPPAEPAPVEWEDCSGWWVQAGGELADHGRGLGFDADGHLYLAGWADAELEGQSVTGKRSAVLQRFGAAADLEWTRTFSSTQHDLGHGLAVDSGGDVILVGGTTQPMGGQTYVGATDGFVSKIGPDGSVVWTTQIGTERNDAIRRVALDADDRIYVVGHTFGELVPGAARGRWDAFVTKIDVDGTVLWTRQLGSADSDHASDVVIDSEGRVYVAGYTRGELGVAHGGWDVFVVALEPDGTTRWLNQLGSPGDERAFALALDDADDLYVGGGAVASEDEDAFVAKLGPEGALLWRRHLGTSRRDRGHALVFDGARMLLAGETDGTFSGQESAGGRDGFVAALELDGTRSWSYQFGSEGDDMARALTIDANGRTVVAGSTLGNLHAEGQGREDLFVREVCMTPVSPTP